MIYEGMHIPFQISVFVFFRYISRSGIDGLHAATATAKSLQSCPTLCDPIDGSPTGSPVPGILQARTLEWVAISFSSAWKWKVKGKSLSRVWLVATPWTAAFQAPLSMGFSRQEYWSGVPLPSPDGLHGSSIFNFLRKLHAVSHSGWTRYHQQRWRVPFCSHLC